MIFKRVYGAFRGVWTSWRAFERSMSQNVQLALFLVHFTQIPIYSLIYKGLICVAQ